MPLTPSSAPTRRPTVDEWGVYDPQQAGMAALYTRLVDTTRSTSEPAASGARARVLPEPKSSADSTMR